ncbi:hypothetical protein LCGC14_1699540 [marine sediment metagenome]|uniref:Uncharacterized protein n=1 Tax=marine sediment metagenome TaxID=412755 RepID=A0A0F9I620_9ZZZZ
MVNIEFRVKPHKVSPGKQMIEFHRDGVFVAAIYPHEDGIRIVSKYMEGVKYESGSPRALVVKLSKEESV